jgi:hypothetical protein
MMVINRDPTKQGWTPPSAGPRHHPDEVLLYAGSCMARLLVVMLIPAS